jgi:tetrapyrrole methylase family protein/MazG family protein
VIAHLRAPDGCPWDREQTHQTLRPNLLEEAYELLSAIDSDDPQAMAEEFGDLLLQIVLHAQIASEYGEFTMADILRGIHTKIVRRHPHVFENLHVEGMDEVLLNWERLKAAERVENGEVEKGLLDGVATSLPALIQSQEYQDRAARVGFDWPDISGVLDKITEEVTELRAAADSKAQAGELGDLLFALVNLARWYKIDAESALREANDRFRRRFRHIEDTAKAQGRELSEMTLKEMDALWDDAKLES